MAATWNEITQASEEKRCELILSGTVISKRIESGGLDEAVFSLNGLNFLEISNTCLTEGLNSIHKLTNLTRLVLRGNKLISIPAGIGQLSKLKFLDLSSNQLKTLPTDIDRLVELQSLNVSFNGLSELPSLLKLTRLVVLNFSHNCFAAFPEGVCDGSFAHLAEIYGSSNSITTLPAKVSAIVSLKVLDLENNAIVSIPAELGECSKLKEVNLKGNPIKDKRLQKLIDQCHVKQVLDYVRSHCAKESTADSTKTAGKSKGKGSKRQQKKSESTDEVIQLQDQLRVLHVQDKTPVITLLKSVRDVRPHIVCCIVRNANLQEAGALKKFLALQTKLHDGICEKRTAATIATHDLTHIQGNLTFEAKPPEEIKMIPLGHKKEMSAGQLYVQMTEEAEALRREKKRNVYSGIHKYLYLLKDKPLFPCLRDESGQVVSFPPITNSQGTKLSAETKDILVEVTGQNLATCKKVLDTLLHDMLKAKLGSSANGKQQGPEDGANKEQSQGDTVTDDEIPVLPQHMVIEQVKVVDEEGSLRVVYPARTDLALPDVNVVRE